MAKLLNCVPFFVLRKVLYSSFVPAKAVSLSYKILGKCTCDPPKPPIFIFHDILGSKRQWEGIGKTIINITHRTVVAVDLRNHGDSPHVNSHKYTHQAADVLQLLDKLGAAQASLIGHSMGGRTAMCVALMAPQKVSGLIVVDISPISTSPEYSEYLLKILKAMEAVDFKKCKTLNIARSEVRKELKDFVADEYIMNTTLANIRRKADGTIGWSCNLDALKKHYNYAISFPETLKNKVYDGPTLFIGGQLSEFIPADDLIQIRGLFPRAILIYIPKTHHRVHDEDPKGFLELTISGLRTHFYTSHAYTPKV